MDLFVCGNRFPQWFDFFSVSYSASVSIIVLKGDELRLFLTKKEEAPTSDSLFLFLPPSSSFFLLLPPSLPFSSRLVEERGKRSHNTLLSKGGKRTVSEKPEGVFRSLFWKRRERQCHATRNHLPSFVMEDLSLLPVSSKKEEEKDWNERHLLCKRLTDGQMCSSTDWLHVLELRARQQPHSRRLKNGSFLPTVGF